MRKGGKSWEGLGSTKCEWRCNEVLWRGTGPSSTWARTTSSTPPPASRAGRTLGSAHPAHRGKSELYKLLERLLHWIYTSISTMPAQNCRAGAQSAMEARGRWMPASLLSCSPACSCGRKRSTPSSAPSTTCPRSRSKVQ